MNDQSLLREALESMERQRVRRLMNWGDGASIDQNNNNNNTLLVSLYVLCEQDRHLLQPTNSRQASTKVETRRKNMLLNLGRVGKRANQLLSEWHRRSATENKQWRTCCPFSWNSGGDGPVFAVHVEPLNPFNYDKDDEPTTKTSSEVLQVPHLRATCHYGDAVFDELLAIGLALHITEILSVEFPNCVIAMEAWDVSDGQIILIEGAEHLPEWCTSPEICDHRVWMVQGEVYFVSPEGGNPSSISRREALLCLLQEFLPSTFTARIGSSGNKITQAPEGVQHSILQRIHGDSTGIKDASSLYNLLWDVPSTVVAEHMHYAPCVLPLRLATAIRLQPDLIPCAVDIFCTLVDQYERERGVAEQMLSNNKRKIRKITVQDNEEPLPATSDKRTQDSVKDEDQSFLPVGQTFPYDHLVVAVLPFSKVRYAMLLTGGGLVPDPLDMPYQYRSVEAARMKRQCSCNDNGSNAKQRRGRQRNLDNQTATFGNASFTKKDEEHHLRNAMEAGVRLTLGFEWFTFMEHLKKMHNDAEMKKNELPRGMLMGDVEQRVRKYWVDIDKSCGGDGMWIEESWEAGPNSTRRDAADISPLVECPVYNPEVRGTLCPLTSSNVSLYDHISTTLKKAAQSDIGSIASFPFPTKDMVDSDEWMSVTPDAFENLMNKAGGVGQVDSTEPSDADAAVASLAADGSESSQHEKLNVMLNHVKEFMDRPSDLEGVHSSFTSSTPLSADNESNEVTLDADVMIDIIKQTVGVGSAPCSEHQDDFFSDDEDDSDSEDSALTDADSDAEENIHDVMRAMDAELECTGVRRTAVSTLYGEDGKSNEPEVSASSAEHSPDDLVKIDVQVLSSLLESLESENGQCGPVSNMLREMGIPLP